MEESVSASSVAATRGNISLVEYKSHLQGQVQAILRGHLDSDCSEGVGEFIQEMSQINQRYKCQLRQPVGMSEDMVSTLQVYDVSLLFRLVAYLIMNRHFDAFRYRDCLSAILDAVKIVVNDIPVSFKSILISEVEIYLFFNSFISLDTFMEMKNACRLVHKPEEYNCIDMLADTSSQKLFEVSQGMDNISNVNNNNLEARVYDKQKLKLYKHNVTYYFKYVYRIFQLYNITASQLPSEYRAQIHHFLRDIINCHELYGLGTKFYNQLFIAKIDDADVSDMSDFDYDLFNDITTLLLEHGQDQCLVQLFENIHALYSSNELCQELFELYIKYFISYENILAYNLAYHLCLLFGKNHRIYSTYYSQILQLKSTFQFFNLINKGKWRLAFEELKHCGDVMVWVGVYNYLRSLGMYEAAVAVYNVGDLQHVAARHNITETNAEEIDLEIRINVDKYLNSPPIINNSIVVINSKDTLAEAQQLLGYDKQRPSVIGIDCEWPAHIYRHSSNTSISLLQIAAANYILLFDLMVLSELPDCVDIAASLIHELLSNQDIIKLGFKMDGAEKKVLRNSYNKIFGTAFDVMEPYQDVDIICKKFIRSQEHIQKQAEDTIAGYKLRKSHVLERKSSSQLSLSDCCYIFLGKKLNKNQQLSDWSQRPLNIDQVKYAALDAYALVSIYNRVNTVN